MCSHHHHTMHSCVVRIGRHSLRDTLAMIPCATTNCANIFQCTVENRSSHRNFKHLFSAKFSIKIMADKKTWGELNDQRDAFLKVPWIEFVKEGYRKEEKHCNNFKQKLNKGWKHDHIQIWRPDHPSLPPYSPRLKKTRANNIIQPVPWHVDSKEEEQKYGRFVKSPRYSAAMPQDLMAKTQAQLSLLRKNKVGNPFINSRAAAEVMFPYQTASGPPTPASSRIGSSRSTSRASGRSHSKYELEFFDTLFTHMRKKVWDDRSFAFQSKKMILNAFNKFDMYNSGIIPAEKLEDAMSILGQPNVLNTEIKAAIFDAYPGKLTTNAGRNGKQITIAGLDFRKLVRAYVEFATNRISKRGRVLASELSQSQKRGPSLVRRSKEIPPWGPL